MPKLRINILQKQKEAKQLKVYSLHAHKVKGMQVLKGFQRMPVTNPLNNQWRNLRIYYGVNNLKRAKEFDKHGEPVVYADPSKEWYVTYDWFEDGAWVTVIVRRGLNRIHGLKAKSEAAEALYEVVLEELEALFDPRQKIFKSKHASQQSAQAVARKQFKEAMEWAVTKNPRKIGKRTMQAYTTNIKYFNEALTKLGYGNISIGELTRWHLSEAYDKLRTTRKTLGPSTLNDYVTNLTWLFKILFKKGVIESNPAEFLDKIPLPEKQYRPRPDDQELKIIRKEITKAPFGFRLYLKLIYQTTIRPTELNHLQVEEIDFDKLYLRLKPENGEVKEKTKNRKSRNVPITNGTAQELMQQIKTNQNPKAFVFGKEFLCTNKMCHRNYYTAYWKEIIKDKHGIQKDMYSLKHRSSDDMTKHTEEINKLIAGLMGHSDTDLVKSTYNEDKSVFDQFIRDHTPEL